MTIDDVTAIIRSGVYTIIITAAPHCLTSLGVGLTVSIFQTVTSIQEQTLTFVPKIVSIFAVLMIAGHWMMNNMISLTENLWNSFALYVK